MSKQAKWSLSGCVILLALAILVFQFVLPSNRADKVTARFGVPSVQASEPIGHIGTGKSAEAVEKAGSAGRYVFALLHREENTLTAKARDLISSARKQISRKSEEIDINVADPAEQDIVSKLGVGRAPMPMVMVLAPNGAIMGGFPASQLTDDSRLVEAVGWADNSAPILLRRYARATAAQRAEDQHDLHAPRLGNRPR